MKTILGSLAMLMLACMPVYSQWKNVPPSKLPRTADGKPDLSAPAPRTADGHPDLSGVWEPAGGGFVANLAATLKPDAVPFQRQGCHALLADRDAGRVVAAVQGRLDAPGTVKLQIQKGTRWVTIDRDRTSIYQRDGI